MKKQFGASDTRNAIIGEKQMSNKNRIETPEEKRQGNKWSLISLICFVSRFVIGLLTGFMSGFISSIFVDNVELSKVTNSFSEVVYLLGTGISVLLAIAALVIIIYVRVKYPNNIFGKVLMWVYIVLFIMYVILMVALIIACGIACNACIDECEKCGQMGMIAIERLMIC